MDENKIELPDLLWSCFINWINTLEKTLKSDPEQDGTHEEKFASK